jgi:hypothetical protein
MRPKRVHEIVTCPQFQNGTYDESRHGGHAVEAVLAEVLEKHGFSAQVEITYKDIVGHPDFVKTTDNYVEFIEVKNTGQMSYLHILQASMYKSLLHKIRNVPIIGYILYVKFRVVLGDNPVTPRWVQDLGMQYVFMPLDAGNNYVNWGLFRVSFKSKLAGPYCVNCRNTDCGIRHIILNGPSSAHLDVKE